MRSITARAHRLCIDGMAVPDLAWPCDPAGADLAPFDWNVLEGPGRMCRLTRPLR